MSPADDLLQFHLGFQPLAPARRIWTPRELMSAVRTVVEHEYSDVWVEGEISNLRPAESGHLYFTLKDDGAQLRAVMFRTQARLLRFRPENGLHVLARGRITVYESRGELQLSAEYLEPKGVGALQIAFEQLKAKLQAEGLFEASRKKRLPALPKVIGVITSPRGAAVQDMINILRRRHAGVSMLIYPAQVQGETAAAEAVAGIKYFNRAKNVDVVVIARGGGSLEDLAPFNDEGLARQIAASNIPVISAIGHETDFTIADFVADLRAPTPSAAAELVTQSKREIEESLGTLRQRLGRATRYQLMLVHKLLASLAQHGAMARMRDVITRRQQRMDDLSHRLARSYENLSQQRRRRMEILAARLMQLDLRRVMAFWRREIEVTSAASAAAVQSGVLKRRALWQRADARLQELSPAKILARGYALVFDGQGNLLKDAVQVRAGDQISARLARGGLSAVVKKTEVT